MAGMPRLARIPGFVLKDKEVDYDREILSMLGQGVQIGTWHFPPPSLGVWALWEVLDSPFVKGDPETKVSDYWRVLWVNAARKAALPHVADWINQGKPEYSKGCAMDREVANYAKKLPAAALTLETQARVQQQMTSCFNGYETIPSKSSAGSVYLFAGESFGAICYKSAAEADKLTWDTPLILLGFVAAAEVAREGAKCARPKDPLEFERVMREACEREFRGEMHPWQRDYPEAFQLSPTQLKFPELVAEFTALLEAKKGETNAT